MAERGLSPVQDSLDCFRHLSQLTEWLGNGWGMTSHDCLRNTAWPCRHLNSLGEHVFAITEKPVDGWGDLSIGTVFAGGENGELLEVVEGKRAVCKPCYYSSPGGYTCGRSHTDGPFCNEADRQDKTVVNFVKLERTDNEDRGHVC